MKSRAIYAWRCSATFHCSGSGVNGLQDKDRSHGQLYLQLFISMILFMHFLYETPFQNIKNIRFRIINPFLTNRVGIFKKWFKFPQKLIKQLLLQIFELGMLNRCAYRLLWASANFEWNFATIWDFLRILPLSVLLIFSRRGTEKKNLRRHKNN